MDGIVLDGGIVHAAHLPALLFDLTLNFLDLEKNKQNP
jgi:hypothetical protein